MDTLIDIAFTIICTMSALATVLIFITLCFIVYDLIKTYK